MTYDVVIIGSGSAGFSAAQTARAQGASVCLIEREKLGGECPNWACVPTKALLKAARVSRTVREAREFGITTSGVQSDLSAALAYARKSVEAITGGGERGDRYIKLAKALDVEVVYGQATFIDEHTVRVNTEKGALSVTGRTFVIATGGAPFLPQINGLSETPHLTFRDIYALRKQPKSMAIVGGGPVGCELATLFSAFGTQVTLIQSAPTILHREDEAIAALAAEKLVERQVEILTDARVERAWKARGGIIGLEVFQKGVSGLTTVAVESLLIAAGKRADTESLDLRHASVDCDAHGSVQVDVFGRSSTKHIFAAGDAVPGPQFTHTAHHTGAVAGHNAARTAKKKRDGLAKVDVRVVPRVTFTAPEVASVGLTQAQAKAQYKRLLVGECRIAQLGRAVTDGTRFGLVKLVADAKSGRIVGGHMIGESAGEVIHEVALAMHLRATMDDLASMIHAFPTYAEGVTAAANAAKAA